MKKGDILLVPFPFTDLSSTKIRPALVLAEKASDIILAFIASKLSWKEDTDLLIEANNENGLKNNSVIKLSKIVTIEKSLVSGKLGNISELQIKQINKYLLKVFNLN